MKRQPKYSLIIPVYNEAARLADSLAVIRQFATALPDGCELIFVDDGSTDATISMLEKHQLHNDITIVRQWPNAGKGWAVRTGMLAANGQYRAFLDADLATKPIELQKLFLALEQGSDIAIGSRVTPEGVDLRVSGSRPQSRIRQVLGKLFHLIVAWVYLGDIRDSQCGAKAFTAAAATTLFAQQHLRRWVFDVEILYLAHRAGYSIAEIPVAWESQHQSKLRVSLSTTLGTLRELVSIWWLHLGRKPLYANPASISIDSSSHNS
jgi:dolichyl-phosphate beta-glucosyltransferase